MGRHCQCWYFNWPCSGWNNVAFSGFSHEAAIVITFVAFAMTVCSCSACKLRTSGWHTCCHAVCPCIGSPSTDLSALNSLMDGVISHLRSSWHEAGSVLFPLQCPMYLRHKIQGLPSGIACLLKRGLSWKTEAEFCSKRRKEHQGNVSKDWKCLLERNENKEENWSLIYHIFTLETWTNQS